MSATHNDYSGIELLLHIYIYIYIYIYNIIWSGTVAKVEQAFRSESLRHKFAKFEPVAGMMKITISGG